MAIKGYYGDRAPRFEDRDSETKEFKNVVGDASNVSDIKSIRIINNLDDEYKEIEFSLLSAKDFINNKNKLGAFYGTKYVEDIINSILDTHAHYFWTRDKDKDHPKKYQILYVDTIRYLPYFGIQSLSEQKYFIYKPVINTSIEFIEALKERGYTSKDGIDIVEFGYYPNSEDKKITKKINRYIKDSIFRDKNIKIDNHSISFIKNQIFIVKGNKYVYLHDLGKAYKIEPVKWIIDYDNNRLISYYGLIAGISFNQSEISYSTFTETTMYYYLNNDFAKELLIDEKIPYIVKKKYDKEDTVDNKLVSSNTKISVSNDLNLLSEIDYNLSILKELNKEKYEEFSNRYNNCINNNCTDISVLGKLSGDILAEITTSRKQLDMFNFFETEKERCMDNFINGVKNELSFEKIDRLFASFISRNKEYDVKTKIKLLKDISLLYLIELYEQKDFISINMINKSYVSFHINNIVIWIREFINKGIIECHYYMNSKDEISIEELINIVKSIEIINTKNTQLKA